MDTSPKKILKWPKDHEKMLNITSHLKMQIKINTRHGLPVTRMATTAKRKVSVGEGAEKLEPLHTTGGNVK